MKLRVGAAVLAWMLMTGTAGGQSVQPSPASEIRPLLNELLAAANAHDTDRFLASYLHDSTLVFVFNGVVTVGYTAVRDGQLKAWNNGKSDVVYSLRSPSDIRVLTPRIVLATMLLASRRTLPTGEAKTAEFTATMVWQKRPEGWRIVQVHESTVR